MAKGLGAGAAHGQRGPVGLLLLAAASLLAACRGVGREVVGQRPEHRMPAESCDGVVPVCGDEPVPERPMDLPPPAAPVDVLNCDPYPLSLCTTDQPVGGDAPPTCELRVTLPAAGEQLPALHAAACATVHIVVDADDGDEPRTAVVDGASLSHANVRIESSAPLDLELSNAELSDVWFELTGPITLRVRSARVLQSVRIAASADGAAQVRVELEDVTGDGLSVGDAERPLRGELALLRSTLHHVLAHVQLLTVESSLLQDASLQAPRLESADATLQRVVLDTERSLLANNVVSDAEWTACDAISLLGGSLTGFRIPGCAQPVRAYGAGLQRGLLDGAVTLDHATLTQTRLGVHEVGPIEAWDSQLTYSRFCAEAPSVVAGGVDTLSCMRCERATDSGEFTGCTLPKADLMGASTESTCEPLQRLPKCEPPLPRRMRPPYM